MDRFEELTKGLNMTNVSIPEFSSPGRERRLPPRIAASLMAACIAFLSQPASADEGGVSYWLPGRFGSLAATPSGPRLVDGRSLLSHECKCLGDAAAAREIQVGRIPAAVNVDLNLHLNAQADLVLLNPTYTFATPVLDGQLAIGVTGLFGRSSAKS